MRRSMPRFLVALILVLPGWVVGSLTPPVTAQSGGCALFDSQIWAQSVYESDPVANAALDPDGNGRACEELSPGAAPALWTDTIPAGAESVTLASVTDGDTIHAIINGQNEAVRLILIDSPETHDPNNPPECYGEEATAYLTWLLSLGGDLSLERDVSDRDRFGRLLRYVWLDFGGGEVYLVNEAMARAGYAAQATFPPDVKYEAQTREAARFAREHGYGLWSGCVTDAAGDTNELTEARGIAAAPETSSAPAAPAAAAPLVSGDCDPAYPDVCIPPLAVSGDLNCGDIDARRFTVYPPDPHEFDGDFDGIGCERD
jgi:micrococcal nuclease